jgi:hypothetical protein
LDREFHGLPTSLLVKNTNNGGKESLHVRRNHLTPQSKTRKCLYLGPMKKILLLLLLIPAICMAQKAPVTYTGIGEINASKDELLTRVQRWMSKQCTDSKTIGTDEVAGSSSFMYNSKIFYGNLGTKGVVKYKISVIVKDGKYKYELTQFTHEGNPNNKVNLSFGLITEDEE